MNKPFYIVFLILLASCNLSKNQNSDSSEVGNKSAINTEITNTDLSQIEPIDTNVIKIITFFREKNIDKIANIIHFPLKREYPIPSIEDEKEFKKGFEEVFDNTLVAKIANSNPKQWSEIGWRGIAFENGDVWLDHEGKIFAVNYQSEVEKELKEYLIAKEKENLHPSLTDFENPVYKIYTKSYQIRIDKLSEEEYRYASWKIGEKENSKPELILNKGLVQYEGNAGNHVIIFSVENYTYKVYRNILVAEESSSDVTLIIEQDNQINLSEEGTLLPESETWLDKIFYSFKIKLIHSNFL